MKIRLVFFVILSLLTVQSVMVAKDKVQPQRVDQERLKSAMETVLKKDTDGKPAYEPTATVNGIRYQTDVIINLLENEASEEACLLFICYKDWYEAFKSVNCQNQDIPEYVRLANKFKQNIVIDYDRQNVIKKINRGGNPNLAANIMLSWPYKFGEESFTYTDDDPDNLSKLKLEVTNERVITYRLLKYDNLIVCDQIEGFKGRALSGFLSFFGKAYMKQYRIVPVKDGPQYVLMKIKRWIFPWKINLTIQPDGVTTDGIKKKKEKQKLYRKIKIKYERLRRDELLKTSEQLAELDCYSDNS